MKVIMFGWELPPFISAVGVFVDAEQSEIVKAVQKCALKAVQLHGGETPEYCAEIKEKLGIPVIKAFRVKDESVIEEMKKYIENADFFLLDAYIPGEPGGTGEVFNWDIAVAAKELKKDFFLAGGLDPENLAEAMEKAAPYGVDTASGVERLPRRKDFEKLAKFIRIARGLK